MVFARIWHMVRGERRRPTSAQTFRRAQRLRDEGRFEDAAALVDSGLVLEPGSVVGHLLAGSLHVILRETGQARTSFERVLALEPTHPRALLGLARIALEENDTRACGDLLTRALARYPDFPEARALLEVVKGLPASDAAKRSAPPNSAIRADRLRLPAESREALLARADATLVFAQPRGPRTEAVVARAAKLSRVAAAMLARAGLGPLRHAVIEGAAETTYLRADDAALLTLAFDRDVKAATAIAHLERVWANCRSELA
ncbi:MAG TPA: tetratricopeptide repeat protein [Candidatus Binatia bacterium]|nr:tetratricopeptide repeat protein [Candidatus Binatia bacterium]